MDRSEFNVVTIPKGNGRVRTIYAPSPKAKALLRAAVSRVAGLAKAADLGDVQHGFAKGRSPVTCALAHVGRQYTWTGDLSDCFDSIKEEMVKGKLPEDLLRLVLVDGSPRQGLPTSPAVANLVLAQLDQAVLRWAKKAELEVVYTRYADDLTVSCDDEETLRQVAEVVPQIVSRCGFRLNPKKTRTYWAKGGRRPVVGVSAGEDGVHPTRKARRKLRAAEHQASLGVRGAQERAKGLAEWCRLRPPSNNRTRLGGSGYVRKELGEFAKRARVRFRFKEGDLPKKEEVWLSDSVVVTGDPLLTLGMSTFTTNWGSCMQWPTGSKRRGTIGWCLLEGTRVGALLSEKVVEKFGVERRAMRARALVHRMKLVQPGIVPEQLVYDRVYGESDEARKELVAALQDAGVWSVDSFRNGRVVGTIPDDGKCRPYLDSLMLLSRAEGCVLVTRR
jgi:hypothetical protein